MNVEESNPPQITYGSPQGLRTLLETAQDHLPFIPHDFSIEVAAQILDQQDAGVEIDMWSIETSLGTVSQETGPRVEIPDVVFAFRGATKGWEGEQGVTGVKCREVKACAL
ncbi:hypothetical protein Moror_9632 [Moniliophthora roreri MCA 2997]|uniref:Uncharacterized protein n=2 Tax=Moniliophthora roreri TaxID=221103 RepID=V2W4V9_MONRO|nr:hypothetical protein Moror_9632 [Moniliophthora roreri MCA 2997]